MVNIAAFYEGPEDRARREAWVSGFAAALRQDDGGAYVGRGMGLPSSSRLFKKPDLI